MTHFRWRAAIVVLDHPVDHGVAPSQAGQATDIHAKRTLPRIDLRERAGQAAQNLIDRLQTRIKDGEQVVSFDEKIDVANGTKVADGIKKNSKEVLNLVVTVEGSLGSGSGFFIGNGGYIISNYHVVGEAKYVKVKFAGGLAVIGEVVRKDAVRDVALIKTAVEPSRSIAVRRSPIKVGEEVYAMGSPFGDQLSGTTTRGIVSAERTSDDLRFIQSDVSINPGNSGGPLVDSAGEALALAVLGKTGATGIGLFIPIAEALEKLGLALKQ